MIYDEENLIIYLCQKVSGIGKKKAIRISGFMEDFENFYQNTTNLKKFKTDKGREVVTTEQINEIQNILNEYITFNPTNLKKLWISILIKDFVKKSLQQLQDTTLDTLLINPFLVKAFGFDDHKEVITFYFYQKITRSIVTSWGFTVEGLLFCVGNGMKSEFKGFDFKLQRNNKNYHLQIKSSPNTMSVEQLRQLNTHIKKIKNKLENIPILGMTYGKREQISSQIQSTLIDYPNSTLIGNELWDFIASENNYCEKILDLIDEIMKTNPTKFSDELEKKRLSLIKDWESNFGTGKSSITKVLKKYL